MKNLILLGLITLFFGKMSGQNVDSLSIYPNPYSTQFGAHFFLYEADTIDYQIYDLTGRTVYKPYEHQFLEAGAHDYSLLNDTLVQGIYMHSLKSSSGFTKTTKVVKTEPAGIIDLNFQKISLFPNPTKEFINLPFENLTKVLVYSSNGKLLKEINHPGQKLSLDELSSGVYIFQLRTKNQEISTIQVVKQ